MTEPLKPCPFCGGRQIEDYGDILQCNSCGACGPFTRDELRGSPAALKWNHRATDATAPRRVGSPCECARCDHYRRWEAAIRQAIGDKP
jgi:hypothetical protein